MTKNSFDSTEGMTTTCREALRNSLIACADTKLLLGYHYGEWTFGPPEIEAAIACCSLCQSELGHVRLFHGLLNKHYGDNPDELVESRKPNEFANISFLDNEIKDWAQFVAVNYIVDLALTTYLASMRSSSFQPLLMSLEKMIQEEKYHIHHGQGWFRALATRSADTRNAMQESAKAALDAVAEWYGPEKDDEDAELVAVGIKADLNVNLFNLFVTEIGELSRQMDVNLDLQRNKDGSWQYAKKLEWNGWDPKSRRVGKSAPDENILYHLRGSKNKVFKLN